MISRKEDFQYRQRLKKVVGIRTISNVISISSFSRYCGYRYPELSQIVSKNYRRIHFIKELDAIHSSIRYNVKVQYVLSLDRKSKILVIIFLLFVLKCFIESATVKDSHSFLDTPYICLCKYKINRESRDKIL